MEPCAQWTLLLAKTPWGPKANIRGALLYLTQISSTSPVFAS